MQKKYFKTNDTIKTFSYDQLENLISEDILIAIPEQNQIKGTGYYDLGALASNHPSIILFTMQEVNPPQWISS